MCLQKLLYYCQAWSLAWDGRPMFRETIRAWDDGPVIGEVFHQYRGRRVVSDAVSGSVDALGPEDRATADAVLAFYGDKSAEWLSELTHRERPWLDARAAGTGKGSGSPLIPHDSMREYYAGLPTGPGKQLPQALMRGLELLVDLAPDEVPLIHEPDEDQDGKLAAWLRGDDLATRPSQ